MRDAFKRLPRLSLRSLFMVLLMLTLTVYDVEWVYGWAPMFFLALPLGCAVIYLTVRSYKGKIGIMNWLLLGVAACLTLGTIRTRDFAYNSLFFYLGEILTLLAVGIVPENMDPDKLRREMLTFGWTLIAIMLPLMILSVLSVFIGHSFKLGQGTIGIANASNVQSRLHIIAHPNIAGRRAEMCILFAIYALYHSKKRWQRVLLWITIVVAMMSIAHSQTRSCTLTLGLIFGALTYRGIYLRMKEKRWRVPTALLSSLVTAAVTVVAIEVIFWVDIHIAVNVIPVAHAEELGVSRSITQGMFNLSDSGRSLIWLYTRSFLRNHPSYLLIGTGAGDQLIKLIAAEYPPATMYWHLHSSFLELLVRGGIPALLCSVVMLGAMVRPCYRMLIAPETDGDRGAYILPIIIGSMLAMTISESMLFIRPTMINVIFFYAVGRVIYAQRHKTIGKVQ